jgi:hypothetical protein
MRATRTVDSYLLVVSGVSTHLGGEAKENPKRLYMVVKVVSAIYATVRSYRTENIE